MLTESDGGSGMYGLIGKMMAVPGQRDALIAILLEGTARMPGCLSYVVAADPADPDALWVTEVWESEESHKASLSLPSVQEAIARGRPLIAGVGERFITSPVGGTGWSVWRRATHRYGVLGPGAALPAAAVDGIHSLGYLCGREASCHR